MIASIVIGSGRNRQVVERERNRAFSKWAGRAICEHIGIKPRFVPVSGSQKGQRRKAA